MDARRPRHRAWPTGVGTRAWPIGVGAASLRHRRPRPAIGLASAIVAVALATFAIYLLRQIAPVVSLSVVYLPAVLLISTYWGLALGLLTCLLSSAAFNFFQLPPTGAFTIFNSRNWVALAAFTIVALAASTIAELARSRALEAERRRAEADLAAALAHELLLGADTETALANAARRVVDALGLEHGTIEPGTVEPNAAHEALALHGLDGRRVATLLVATGLPADTEQRLRGHVIPTLEALVEIAERRDALQAELVETAALRRSDELKTALLRAVSHDLRTPLTAVVAAGHALRAESLTDQERAELSAAVVEEGTRLAGLVDNLLALSRIQAGAATPRSDWVSVEDLVAAAVEGLRGAPVDIHVHLEPGLPDVRADAAQIERALANLLENAGRHAAGTRVTVSARRLGSSVVVSVEDRGPGIGAAEQGRIFEPFYRGDDARARGSTGSGLGLAIVKGFVEANGGTIDVSSKAGQGTSFTVSLPVVEPAIAEIGSTQ
ncbi:MAG: sensor histidine kinase [Solirubrobacteraceae bacterium]